MASIDVRTAFALPAPKRPDYDVDVLQPLRIAQAEAEKARLAAIKAADEAAAREAVELATQQAQAAQIASTQAVAQGTVSGSCIDWLNAAGVTDIANAMILINRESHCNPFAVNPSSGSCNVAQELPCGKSGCQVGDGACSVRWMNQYVLARYGSWQSAVAHSFQFGWY